MFSHPVTKACFLGPLHARYKVNKLVITVEVESRYDDAGSEAYSDKLTSTAAKVRANEPH